eukprot:scaffold8163_cov417-Prasinococcus_capsulatus_cf.AAC.3
MAVGLCVDFLLHIGFAYVEASRGAGHGNHRSTTLAHTDAGYAVDAALLKMGPATLNGALSTMVGVIVLAFAKYYLFKVYYFRMYLCIVILGLVYGLVFFPVCLRLLHV